MSICKGRDLAYTLAHVGEFTGRGCIVSLSITAPARLEAQFLLVLTTRWVSLTKICASSTTCALHSTNKTGEF